MKNKVNIFYSKGYWVLKSANEKIMFDTMQKAIDYANIKYDNEIFIHNKNGEVQYHYRRGKPCLV